MLTGATVIKQTPEWSRAKSRRLRDEWTGFDGGKWQMHLLSLFSWPLALKSLHKPLRGLADESEIHTITTRLAG